MYELATTRFNNETWNENQYWRDNNEWKGCVYGLQKKISESILNTTPIFVLEMHNDKNNVMGVGLIYKKLILKKRPKIYKDYNYNFYIYKSKYRLDRSDLSNKEFKIIKLFDILLFKGARHVKRGQGILRVPCWIVNNKHINFIKHFKKMFNKRFDINI
tara:strand:+ start:49124 stop:49600 length:477 start_codon:yes stop_codon:yes gene_type:complete